MQKEPQAIFIDVDKLAKKIFFLLIIINIIFVILDSLQHHVKILYLGGEYFRSIYSIKYESSIGTWHSVMLNMFVGCTAFLCFLHGRIFNKKTGLCWLIIGIFFVYLSIDDHVILHEQFGYVFKQSIFPAMVKGSGGSFRLPSYGWQFVYAPLFTGMGLFIICFLLKVLSNFRYKMLTVAALVFFVTAVFLDFWEGSDKYFNQFCQTVNLSNKDALHWFRISEEFFEMTGSVLFFYVFLCHLSYLLSIHPVNLIPFTNDKK